MAPLLPAYVPFGLLVGAAAAASANPWAAWLATWAIYGGAAHLAVLDVLAHGSGWVAAAVVGLLVNTRLTAYAAAMAPAWRTAPAGRRAVAALMLTDAPWALARERPAGQQHFYLGAAGTLFAAWPVLVTAGVLAHRWVAAVPVATLLPALTLGALVVPHLRERPVRWAVAAATVVALATAPLAAGPALLLAAVAGVGAGLLGGRSR
jgi:predicted branched-subunit amino acid permease